MRMRRYTKPPVVRQHDPVSRGGHMSYVPCPECGDAVAGRIPQPPEELKLTCVHCKQTFTFEPNEVRGGLVFYNPETNRWKAHTLADMLGI
jgi:hypothetical protein